MKFGIKYKNIYLVLENNKKLNKSIMTAKQAVSEIKAVLQQFGVIAAPKVSFKTEDDTIFQADKFEVGNAIEKMNDKFEFEAVEDGTYKSKDGFSVEVKDSKIVAVKEAFLDAKLADGTQIKVEGEELMEGAKVLVVTEEAEISAPDGIHELEDGTKVETKDGLIVKVEKPEPKVEVEIEAEDDASSDNPEMIEMVEMMKDFIKKMDEKMGSMKKKMESMEADFNAFKKAPAGKKISDGKTEQFNKQENMSDIDAKIAGIMKLKQSK